MADQPDELLTADTLHQWCQEIREQPSWRREADKCEDYYAGNQIDAETAATLEERGMGELITNLVAPTINTVLGWKQRHVPTGALWLTWMISRRLRRPSLPSCRKPSVKPAPTVPALMLTLHKSKAALAGWPLPAMLTRSVMA